ncbi:phosphatidylglycerophosphatase A [bacterium 3DAC]|nr:phosphatidylglycerophosphatase A [Dictyoglomota bacterium]UZN23738.1 phosphatidylglycerophosphatase A [bacterium 3DAC]
MKVDLFNYTIERLKEIGVSIDDMAELVMEVQKKYYDDITIEECRHHVLSVLKKREVQHTVITGLELDRLAKEGVVEEPLLSILRRDEPLYGVDEILALGITNVYGTIGLTNFGYLDKVKPGVIAELNNKKREGVHTFADDLVAAIVAAACSRLAHSKRSDFTEEDE